MPVVAVIGAQWGDEGKGHIVDLLAERARLVIRYGGGNNAGHTVVNDRGAFKLHVVPSGIFDPSTVNVIGNGVVVDPAVLLKELEDLQSQGISMAKLFISERAHVVMPYHVQQDQYEETLRGDNRIGTTGRGIGPAYADKMARSGIRLGDLLHEETLLSRLRQVLEAKNKLLTAIYNQAPLSLHEIYLRYLDYGRRLADHVTDTHPIIQRALDKDVPILLEGAQGALSGVDHGTTRMSPLRRRAPQGPAKGLELARRGSIRSPVSLRRMPRALAKARFRLRCMALRPMCYARSALRGLRSARPLGDYDESVGSTQCWRAMRRASTGSTQW